MVVAAAVYQFVADALDDNPDQFVADPNLARLLTNGAYSLNPEGAVPLVAPLVLAASLVFLGGRLLPRWLGWMSAIFTLIFVVLAFLPFISWFPALVWLLVVSIGLLVSERHAASQEQEPVPGA